MNTSATCGSTSIISYIDETINLVQNKSPDFTSPIKDIAEINCIFDKYCEVALELDEQDRLSSYYSLISTNEGHMPVPIFLEYAGLCGRYSDDEYDISVVKNMLYFIRGYDETIPEYERDYSSFNNLLYSTTAFWNNSDSAPLTLSSNEE